MKPTLSHRKPSQSHSGRAAVRSAKSLAAKSVAFPARKSRNPTISKSRPQVALLPESFPGAELHRVTFQFFNPIAREVFVTGSFLDWLPRAKSMQRDDSGQWVAELFLRPGEYEYRLVVDGAWQDDPMAARFVANPFGGLNSVISVNPARNETPTEGVRRNPGRQQSGPAGAVSRGISN